MKQFRSQGGVFAVCACVGRRWSSWRRDLSTDGLSQRGPVVTHSLHLRHPWHPFMLIFLSVCVTSSVSLAYLQRDLSVKRMCRHGGVCLPKICMAPPSLCHSPPFPHHLSLHFKSSCLDSSSSLFLSLDLYLCLSLSTCLCFMLMVLWAMCR